MMLVVALLLTAVSTGVCARESRADDAVSEDCPTVPALRHRGSLAAEHSGGHRIRVFHSRHSGEEKEALEKLPISIERQQEVLVSPKAWSRLSAEDQKMLCEVERN